MKKSILSLLVLLAAVPAFAERKACTCYELERRLNGLEYVVRNVNISTNELYSIERQIRTGERYYAQVDFFRDTQDTQNRLCSLGNQSVDSSWVRWQPWLARHGVDYPPRCQEW